MSHTTQRLADALSGRYRIEGEAGAGGMATVFRAHDLKHDRPVAIKVLHGDLATPEGTERFHREVRIAAKLNHESILPLFDSGAVGELLYYVMPFVEGPTLRDRIRDEGELSVGEALRILREIADGLQYAHDQGVIHRDIKPANILLRRGRALVADFGISKAVGGVTADDATLTVQGISLGTPAYMSPEQGMAQRIDQRADVYSLGCVLFEMLTARPPFKAPSVYGVLAKHANEPRPSVRDIRSDVPAHIDHAIQKAMAIDVDDRFASCAEFVDALGGVSRVTRPSRKRLAAAGLGALLIVLAGYVGTHLPTQAPDRAGVDFADTPPPSAWIRRSAEAYSVVATADSLLLLYRFRAASMHAFDGTRWTAFSVPDSFELRPYRGVLPDRRLLATRRLTDRSGNARVQLWWLALTSRGLSPVEPLAEPAPEEPQPYWWSDGTGVITWLEMIRRKTPQGWQPEPTGAAGAVVTMWGPNSDHRFAIADAPRDSLLIHDGIGWQRRDILPAPTAGRPWYAGGALLGDGTSVVFGEQCRDDARCTPLVLQEPEDGIAWVPVVLGRGSGIPQVQAHRPETGCVNRFDFLGAAGRSSSDYYVWGEWTFCRGDGSRLEEDSGCPPAHPCVWHVVAGALTPSPSLVGKVMMSAVVVRGAYHAVFDDGTVWADTAGSWRPVSQLPDLTTRRVGAGPGVVIMSTGGRVTYQQSGASRSRLVVSPVPGTPLAVSDSMPPRMLRVRDTTIVLVTASGTVLSTTCHEGRSGSTTGTVRCDTWRTLGGTPEPVLDADIIPDGSVIALGERGFVGTWRDGAWRRELLPSEMRDDSAWAIRVTSSGEAIVVGSTMVAARRETGRWVIDARLSIGADAPRQLVALPGAGLAVGDGRIRAWESVTDTSSVIELHRRVRGEGQVSALHALKDGRLVAGFENTYEPGVGGWLQVWVPPLRDNRSRRIDLPINVDVTDLADDGTLLYVVGRGGSMAIRLDSLPFAPAPGPARDGSGRH